MALFQDGDYGRMYPVPSVLITGQTSGQSLTKWQTSGRWLLSGISSMHSSSECPNEEGGYSSSLALILESSDEVSSKYYLSPKAAEGILRRAGNRGKVLPKALEVALKDLAAKMPEGGMPEEPDSSEA
jgi:hypothetical protein